VRRLVLLTAVAALAIAGVAYAVTDTVTYSTKISFKGKPTSKKPANLSYTGILHVDTANPPGLQPDVAPTTTVYYSKAIKNNATHFPFCSQGEIDGQPSIPAKCKKAIIGTGTASALAGAGGGSAGSSRQQLGVTVVNGTSGKFIMLVLNNKPGSVVVQNRVIPGVLGKASGQYGTLTRFKVPANLQDVAGIKISLTDFNVKLPSTHTVKVKGKSISFLQLTSCKGSLPAKVVANFIDSGTGQTKAVTSPQTNAKC